MRKQYNINDLGLTREKKEKHRLIAIKENTEKSLKEVEFFIGNWRRIFKGIRLYKILKK